MKKQKINFIQDCGIFDYVFNVYVGLNKEELKKDLVRFKDIDKMIETLDECDFNSGGFVAYDGTGKRILWLPRFTSKWEDLSNLAHEIHHMVFLLAKQKGFEEEIESQAYLFQYLLDNMYKKLTSNRQNQKRVL